MGFGPKPMGMIRAVIKQNHETKTFQRPNFTQSSSGETTSTTQPVELTVWLFRPSQANVQNDFGERLEGDMGGLCIDTEDVQVNDRVEVGGRKYEVNSIDRLPNGDNVRYKFFSLVRRTNDR